MAIITISREMAALGDETAHELATQLNYRFVDRNALEEKIKSYGISGDKLQKYDEKKPSYWAAMSQDRDDYLHFLKSAVLAEAAQGSTIFIGRGAGIILKEVPGVFSVFLVAPLQIRLERVKSYFQCDEKRARQIIEQSDSNREGFHRYFFDVKWQDVGNYHLALNTGHLHPGICAEMVKYMQNRIMTEEAEAKGARKIRELVLGEEIKHRIMYEKGVPVHLLEVSVTDNRVIIYGITSSHAVAEAAVSAAGELAPQYSLESQIQVVREYSIMP